MKACGSFFSWSNKGLGDTRVSSRIDRYLCNSTWHFVFPISLVEYLNPGVSDHSPLVIHGNL